MLLFVTLEGDRQFLGLGIGGTLGSRDLSPSWPEQIIAGLQDMARDWICKKALTWI